MDNKESKIISRPPIVAVMGHIDHGKTKLLDAIRKTNVAGKESGGITQHIGAYEVIARSDKPEYDGRKITFLDTPGHEAFSRIRERGATVGDIAVLVVAADEGVKPQTLEALRHIQEAKMPFVVAINKIDRPEANPDKIKGQLAENNVFLEGWGGSIPFVLVSAKEEKNIGDLLETILLLADLEDLKSDLSASAGGVIIESKLDNRRGPSATLIIKRGILRTGDRIASTGGAFGKIKIMEDWSGRPLKESSFSSPVLVIGFKDVPQVGDNFAVGLEADSLVAAVESEADSSYLSKDEAVNSGEKQTGVFNLILKADVAGSLEALEGVMERLFGKKERSFKIISSSVGDISVSDIKLAENTGSWLIGFRSKLPRDLVLASQNSGLKMFLSDIIYRLEEDLAAALDEVLAADSAKEKSELLVSIVFSQQGKKRLIGGLVESGKMKKGKVKIVRVSSDGEEAEIGYGKIMGLQCHKAEVADVAVGAECGLMIETGALIEKGDKIVFLQ